MGSELHQALAEVQLVANPGPLSKAERVMSELELLFGVLDDRRARGGRVDVALERVGRAQQEFIEACRHDLWYRARWWHLWRGDWWRTVWRATFGPKRVQRGGPQDT